MNREKKALRTAIGVNALFAAAIGVGAFWGWIFGLVSISPEKVIGLLIYFGTSVYLAGMYSMFEGGSK